MRTLAASAEELRQRLREKLDLGGDPALRDAQDSLSAALGREVGNEEAADVLAQTATCAAPSVAAAPRQASAAWPWLLDQTAPWERWVLAQAFAARNSHAPVLVTEYSVRRTPPSPLSDPHLYESFLQHYSKRSRKRCGVFFTPQSIADYIVSEADRLLREECGLDDGLGSPQTWILDPAVGTGVFLLTVVDCIHRRLVKQWQGVGRSGAEIIHRWNEFVPTLLPRLVGIEILPAAALLAKLNIAAKLAETGYHFGRPAPLNILLGDALSPAVHAAIRNPQSAFPVVLGNPPFSSLSTNTNDWIACLVRGDDEIRGYVRANGQSLNERKTWLHDDYVKFIRLAQWHVEQAGCGLIGFVTNHGYLDNTTFRLMRQELLRVFPHVQIVDLHGNRKKHEVSPDGSRDENVFELDQGVAIGLFCRPLVPTPRASDDRSTGRVTYTELWGSRESKLEALGNASLARRASMTLPPHWRFVPSLSSQAHLEYESAWSLADAMPVNTTAPVTARDQFVVGFTEEELQQRIAEFRDLSIPDDEIRRRYFTRTRSARYQSGDTRGWKLSAARRIVAADDDWQSKIIRCLYRPFDWRYVFWHPAMIDWPRADVTRHLIVGNSSKFKVQSSRSSSTLNFEPGTLNPVCLIARRQQLPSQPCTFFWIADGLALDGVIRSDNRGSESLFPLYLQDADEHDRTLMRPNFAPAFLERVQSCIDRPAGPESLLAYIYALFHSTTYRERYADELRTSFPRIVLPTSAACFDKLSDLGRQLIDCHLLRGLDTGQAGTQPPEVESFRAGGYVALRKWLQPKHRSPQDPEFPRIVAAISQTLNLMAEIDRVMARDRVLP